VGAWYTEVQHDCVKARQKVDDKSLTVIATQCKCNAPFTLLSDAHTLRRDTDDDTAYTNVRIINKDVLHRGVRTDDGDPWNESPP
jgi:predicted kinase